MKSAEIRQAFLKFFESKGHTIVPSSSLVPADDPTLLFTNAGMNQFKDVFLGEDQRDYSRAVSSQRCVRAGGKHNDLENVGYTARHHTFFEMLGNFSFGDYFKEHAISYAWEFLTSSEWMNIPTEKLWVTVYAEDQEAFDIWSQKIGVPDDRIIRIGDNKGGRYQSDNFWAMGDTGPCGPCSEIFYDHGEGIWGGPPGSPEEDGDRYIEIWNNVFMQYNRSADGSMEPLPAPSVDTGMGLERISAVMQSVHSNYEIDLFQNLLRAVAQETKTEDLENTSLRVIADHLRSCAFLVVDGVAPSNEGRGYVLRRIMRRAIRHGHKLGQTQPFFHALVKALVDEMGQAYPELLSAQEHVERIFLLEEEQFAKTLDKGMAVLESELVGLKSSEIPGQLVFTLYDTYGFPVDLTADIARERQLTIDETGYEALMEQQRKQSRAAGKFEVDYNASVKVEGNTEFEGYSHLVSSGTVTALLNHNGDQVGSLLEGQKGIVVLDKTPFYGESGGQVGDTGYLSEENGLRVEVRDCTKQGANHLHHVQVVSGELSVGSLVATEVNASVRALTAKNHSATHLLHAALRKILGEHVTQKGSLVDSERLRFDFSHFEGVNPDQLEEIEALVNAQIWANEAVQVDVTDMETAKSKGAMALFGEKYGDEVRVLSMGKDRFSVELCGGTHVERTGDIGLFRIVSESGIAAGVRRIEAVTEAKAMAHVRLSEQSLAQICDVIKAKPDSVVEKVAQLRQDLKVLEKELSQAKAKLAQAASSDLLSSVKEVRGVKVLAAGLSGVDGKSLGEMADKLKDKLGSGVVFLASGEEGKVVLIAGVTKDLTQTLKAGDLIKHVAPTVGGKGGGRPDMARGGGTDLSAIDAAVSQVYAWVEAQSI
ncbi:alanine--tRNA ligase [Marinibactrum halimedae]|uniref:Alanine--tRNA ligase n=1 Tax=Marinibactrum halimedae TaxID=1444977 RepID=A0AA37T3A7_9GAMM|nr:alanine--tRNA ligase [Marinibactrum halimedae]MCD9458640.1 alanine--tRNA ligase [Marinibactrum halimedae]GLS25995.1 alanine--tRNA ligase [Marinibactrum halimedae]